MAPQYSQAVLDAKQRRADKAAKAHARDQWFIEQAVANTKLTVRQRMEIATEYLRTKVVKNISVPVIKTVVSVGKQPRNEQGHFQARRRITRVSGRSKPGEFPRADTTLLMKSIIGTVEEDNGGFVGYVGTPVSYGVILEMKMDRSFLVRTLHEEKENLRKIFLGGQF